MPIRLFHIRQIQKKKKTIIKRSKLNFDKTNRKNKCKSIRLLFVQLVFGLIDRTNTLKKKKKNDLVRLRQDYI